MHEEPSYSISFCSMNCGNPIVLDIETICQETESNKKFSNWLIHGGTLSLDEIGSRTIKDRAAIWKLVEKHRTQYFKKVRGRYKNLSIEDLIQKSRKTIKKKAHLETSHGTIERDPVIVFTRPLNDFATWYTYTWADQVIDKAKKKFITIDLGLELANRKNLEAVFSELDPMMYVHYGHGNERCVIGSSGREIINEQNCGILRNCIVHATACYTAVHLGNIAIEKGCIGYMGYDKDFRFVTRFNALDMQIREIYKELDKKGMITLKDMKRMEKIIRMLIVRCLEHNRDSLRLLGDEKARIA